MASTYTEIAEIPEGWIDPVDNGILTSLCSARTNPILGKAEYHNGIDIAAEEGSNVYAVRNGTVTNIHYSETYGNVLTIETKDGYKITYGQLQEPAVGISDTVEAGTVIGKIAKPTRYFTEEGSNLYFELDNGDTPVDPLTHLIDK